MDVQTRGTIQSVAAEAKKRMKLGYWNDIKERRRTEERPHTGRCGADTLTKEEEQYYARVKKILSAGEDEVIINPIAQLMDKQHYSELSPSDKQQYVFRLSEIYISIKKKIAAGEAKGGLDGRIALII
ncbi:MAG: hypothetical protein LBT20_08390 [Clostridiales bacterium]|nr:hypothetical protein [Clostridiales bacterium]